jgi:hypothetical protein
MTRASYGIQHAYRDHWTPASDKSTTLCMAINPKIAIAHRTDEIVPRGKAVILSTITWVWRTFPLSQGPNRLGVHSCQEDCITIAFSKNVKKFNSYFHLAKNNKPITHIYFCSEIDSSYDRVLCYSIFGEREDPLSPDLESGETLFRVKRANWRV